MKVSTYIFHGISKGVLVQRSTGVEMYLRLYALVLGLLLYEWDLAHGAPSKTSIVEGQEG